MKNTISVYWPLVIVVPLAVLAFLHVNGQTGSRASQMPLDANHLTAELARAVSYGMIDTASALPAKPMRAATATPLAEAS
ncbi:MULTISPECIES: hypothetical protein [unclassified Paraburkholderia]|uniref:hypothetical protein n=1 Tax=unclassified Paraburkholderia TaxID=2615204 RepID=UPI0016189759|nr:MULTISPECIES: hypothetical protein [unclassified Paraburkholderia]MBB5443617.1 hypothetical protein [Paraburkholderia sp. WSM4177]MBB5484162.1 hypothetical protein [Paraburkholderia sp. WSM4180]